ncbi:MAG TPA: hypothetical protein VGZ47_11670 [Gemmataceae bacterium]|jgi:hypothetical protein|nr:hypothetical protein [Gemmataceae bacterium]
MSTATTVAAVREKFYSVIGAVPESEAAWTERQKTLRAWRSDSQFEPFWPSIDQMLTDDFTAFRSRAAVMQSAGHWEGYDYDAWREQREYDRQHAEDDQP